MGKLDVTTVFLGKLIDLYLVAISIGMLANRRRAVAALDEMARSSPWMLFPGMAATAGGLAIVLSHEWLESRRPRLVDKRPPRQAQGNTAPS